MKLNPLQNDRAAGVLVALAVGDALGAAYEFGPPLPDETPELMKGGGPFGFDPAEWTDDTSMAIPLARALVWSGPELASDAALTIVVREWSAWAAGATDVGAQTNAVMAAATHASTSAGRPTNATDFAAAAKAFHGRTGRSAGNGSLMRTAPLALAYLDREPGDGGGSQGERADSRGFRRLGGLRSLVCCHKGGGPDREAKRAGRARTAAP